MFRKKKQVGRKSPSSSSSRQVFSYHSSRAASEPDRARKDVFDQQTIRMNRSLKHIPTYVALLLIITSLAYMTILDVSNPQVITLAESTPNILRDNQEYKSGFADILDNKILSRSKLTINTNDLALELQNKYPELDKVSVILPLVGKRPIVQISPAQPSLILKTDKGSFIVGSNGKALLTSDSVSTDQLKDLPIVTDSLADSVELGSLVLPLSTLDFIKQLDTQLKTKQLKTELITLPVVANELHLKLEGKPYIIKFDLQNDVLTQVGSYFTVSEYLTKNSQPDPAQYIDVRIEERVYYK